MCRILLCLGPSVIGLRGTVCPSSHTLSYEMIILTRLLPRKPRLAGPKTQSAGVGSRDQAWPLGGAVAHTSRSAKGCLAGRWRGRAGAQSREEGLEMTRFGAPGTGWWQCY